MSNSIIVIAIASILMIILIIIVANGITRNIIKVKDMSKCMAGGDFSIERLQQKSHDEIGVMTAALNEMLEANRNEMLAIAENSNIVGENCGVLQTAVKELQDGFEKINQAIHTISSAMMDNSATTEELTASVMEIKETVTNLSQRATESENMSREIMGRAQKIEAVSTESFDSAMKLSKQFERRLESSIDHARVVNNIETMDDVNIAVQNIAMASQDAAEESTVILDSVETVSGQVEKVGDISSKQREISNTLDQVVGRYKLN